MKKILSGLAALVVLGSVAMAATVNPASNVLGDTAATASTLVFRDTNGVFDAASLQDATVVTAKLGTASVTTAKMYLDQPAGYVLCVTTAKRLGYCSIIAFLTGACSCN